MKLNKQAHAILSSDTKFILEMLFLLRDHKDWITIEEITKATGYERRTIMKYTALLKKHTDNIPSQPIEIQVKNTKGIRCILKDRLGFNQFILEITESSLSIKILRSIFFNKGLNSIKFIQDNFISESTFKRTIEILRIQVDSFDIHIVKSGYYYYLEGDEKQIRYYAYLAFWLAYQGSSWPFPSIEKQTLTTFLNQLLGNSFQSLQPIHQTKLHYMLAITYTRYQLQYKINDLLPIWQNYMNISKEYLDQYKCNYMFENFLLPSNEVFFFVTQLQAESFIYSTYIGDYFMRAHKNSNTLSYEATHILKKKFKEEYNILTPYGDDDLFTYYALTAHVHSHLYENFTEDLAGYEVNLYPKSQYPELYKKIHDFIVQLQNTHSKKTFSNVQYLHYRYILLFVLQKKPSYFEEPLYINFITDQSPIIKELSISKIKAHFSSKYNLFFVDDTAKNKVNIVVSTNSIPELTTLFFDTPILYISHLLTNSDLKNLEIYLLQIYKKKNNMFL
ncbi:helix-turn-helix domain-containing protein [Brochothrix thermosphacta]|uniref:Mga helix-turn-helix domain-containing protein n=1 Tax=Brochothrix thermosphacta TaxID=2756 RepID=A0A2X0S5S6_BROTH|nr:helix-turn-helix domain-containing protein [Brochothrix thermosphacta]SPP27431.1 conserved hypothetical protein [Brochothrix thermosphacta]